MGRYVTGLAAAQQASGSSEVAIVMPMYSYMRKLSTYTEMEMTMEVHGKLPGQTVLMEFRVFLVEHAFNPPVQSPSRYEWQMINNINTSVLITPQREPIPTDVVPIYMISPGNRRPFTQSFKSSTANDIYNENPHISQEWQDQFFAKAAAAFVAHRATASDEESIFAPIRIVPRVDIVHIHGVSNAFAAKYLMDKRNTDDLGPRPPAIVYTMHDTDELKYATTFKSVRKFLENPIADRERLYKYIYGGRMFMSKFAVDHADAVTFSSRALAAEFVEGNKEIYLKELVMDGLLRKVQKSRFYGIDGAVDYYSADYPFISDKLFNRSMLYPQYALDSIRAKPFLFADEPYTLTVPDNFTQWTLPTNIHDFVHYAKDKAKKLLIRRRILIAADLKRPVVLFHGKFILDAGLEDLERAAELFVEKDMRLIILGTRKGYPYERLEALQKKYPEHVYVISLAKDERRYGVYCRAAADFVYVPRTKNELWLQAMDGLVYGSAVIAPAGARALVDRPVDRGKVVRQDSAESITLTSHEYYNSYFYNNLDESFATAVSDAAQDYKLFIGKSKVLREEFILRMIRGALNLAWSKGHHKGPVHEYDQLYALVLQDRLVPYMRQHEVEQEDELVSRLS